MSDQGLVQDACRWCYRGVWGVLSGLFLVPVGPPDLPAMEKETIEYLRPSLNYLKYLKFLFWFGFSVLSLFFFVLWLAMLAAKPMWGILMVPLWLIVCGVPQIICYIALFLGYDTTWYVLSDRSMRIRRGIWRIDESTITFENIQNVSIVQGPLQRWFGFANLMVSTAGGGSGMPHSPASTSHFGLLEGIVNAAELRERIMAKSQVSAGLGDENLQVPTERPGSNRKTCCITWS